jgi:hypothetical protein
MAIAFRAAGLLNPIRRVIVVRRGDVALFNELQSKWRDDPTTIVVHDRRRSLRLTDLVPERRLGSNAEVIQARGFYTQRLISPR